MLGCRTHNRPSKDWTVPASLLTSQHTTARPIIADSPLGGPLMLSLGRLRSRTCQGLTRRAVLQIGASSVFGLSLADLLRCRAEGGERAVGTAKSVLLLWMWGGPSQLDTWDPKPNASLDYRGPFGSIATKTPGLRVCELFPKIAKLSDRFAVLRSLHTGSSDHGVAGTIGLTGSAGRRRRTRRQAAAQRRAADDRKRGGARARRRREIAAVHRGRRPAASGQESHRRRRRRHARRHVRSVSVGIRPGSRHAHSRAATARRPHAGTARRPPAPAGSLRPAGAANRRGAELLRPSTTTAPRRSPC